MSETDRGALGCVVGADGALRCWGRFSGFDPGLGECDGASPEPVRVALPRPARRVAARGGYVCAELDDRTVRCFGRVDTHDRSCAGPPHVVRMSDGERLHDLARLGAGIAVSEQGAVLRWDDDAPTARRDGRFESAVDAARGLEETCVLGRGGRVSCRGDGGTPDRPAPSARGRALACQNVASALASVDAVHAWRRREGSYPIWEAPRQTWPVGPTPVDVAVGELGGCVLDASGRVQCWGLGVPGGDESDATLREVRLR